MIHHYKDLFEYARSSNAKYIEAIPESDETANKLMSHIINAHAIWNSRILGERPEVQVWEIHETARLDQMDQENFENSVRILSYTDLESNVFYEDSKGHPYKNFLKDILTHIINHSTYHRAQIATLFRENGLNPIRTDFIIYKR